MENKVKEQYEFVGKCIDSCKHYCQLEYCKILIQHFETLNPKEDSNKLYDMLLNKDISIALDK